MTTTGTTTPLTITRHKVGLQGLHIQQHGVRHLGADHCAELARSLRDSLPNHNAWVSVENGWPASWQRTHTGFGYPVLQARAFPHEQYQVVLCHCGPDAIHPWVTWIMSQFGGCAGGRYFATREEAEHDLAHRR